MRRSLAALLLALLLPVCALAAPDTPYAADTVVQTAPLSEGALAALEALYPAVCRVEETIELPDRTSYDDANAAMRCLSRNYPELFHLENEWTIGYYQSTPEYANAVSPAYSMTAQEYEARLAWLLAVTENLISGVTGTEADRAELLHDRLCERAAYDQSEAAEADNTAYGALIDGVTRCEGYAQALSLMYRLAGIPCGVVIGEAFDEAEVSRHAWNLAVIEGAPTLIDATWNDQEDSGITHWYYGLTTDMMAADHQPDPDFDLPECASLAVNWHARRGLLVRDKEEVSAVLRRFALEGAISIRFADGALYEDFASRMHDWFSEYNAASVPGEAFYGTYSVISSDGQRCMLLRRVEEDFQ